MDEVPREEQPSASQTSLPGLSRAGCLLVQKYSIPPASFSSFVGWWAGVMASSPKNFFSDPEEKFKSSKKPGKVCVLGGRFSHCPLPSSPVTISTRHYASCPPPLSSLSGLEEPSKLTPLLNPSPKLNSGPPLPHSCVHQSSLSWLTLSTPLSFLSNPSLPVFSSPCLNKHN